MLTIILVTGFAIGLANPLTLITVSDSVQPENRNSVLALRSIANYGAQATSQVVYGVIMQATAFVAPVFFFSGAFMLLTVFIAVRILKKGD